MDYSNYIQEVENFNKSVAGELKLPTSLLGYYCISHYEQLAQFSSKFNPDRETAFIYSATIKTESSGKSQTFDYDGAIHDEEYMANAVEGFLVWIIDTDKI